MTASAASLAHGARHDGGLAGRDFGGRASRRSRSATGAWRGGRARTAPVDERVFWIVGPRRRARLRLRGSFFVVGRGEPFPVFRDDPTLSREHLCVVASADGVRVRDLGSKNGTLLNGVRLARYAEVALSPGDALVVGQTQLRLLAEGEDPEEALRASTDELEVQPDGASRTLRAADVQAAAATAAEERTAELDAPSSEQAEGEATLELDAPGPEPEERLLEG
jgi:pSer/pThr/pTyr-binding forkhead associated (FHA) protein